MNIEIERKPLKAYIIKQGGFSYVFVGQSIYDVLDEYDNILGIEDDDVLTVYVVKCLDKITIRYDNGDVTTRSVDEWVTYASQCGESYIGIMLQGYDNEQTCDGFTDTI